MKKIAKIQYITRDDALLSHSDQARLMFENGIEWVQIRMKNSSKEQIREEVAKAMEYASELGGVVIVNDLVDIAKETKAHGVHLGLKDLSVAAAREILGQEAIIGGTANTIDDIEKQVARGVDYLGLGPFRYTETKQNLSPVIGIDGYRILIQEMKNRKINVPVVAVGGITLADIEDISNQGLNGVAISKALLEGVQSGQFNITVN